MESHFPQSLNSNSESHAAELNSTELQDWACILEVGSLGIVAILGAVISLFVFLLYFNKSSLRTFANTFVLSLNASDFLRCVFLLPIYIIFLKRWTPRQVWCKSFSLLSLWLNMASVHSILLIACDRYRAVTDPLHYIKINSKWRARILVICIWLFSLLVAVPIAFGFPELDFDTCDIKVSSTRSIFDPSVIYEVTIILTSFVLPLLSVTCLYYGMYRAAKNNQARCERYSCSSCGSSEVAVNMKSQSSSGDSIRRHLYTLEGEHSRQKNRFLNKHRAAVTGLLVVFSFIIFWSPYFVIRFYQQFKVVTMQVKFWAQFFTYLSGIVDPYVYFYRNRSTWNYTINLFSRLFHRRKTSMYLPTNITQSIVTISNLCHTTASQSQAVTSGQYNQGRENRYFCRFSQSEQNGKVKITLYGQDFLQKKNNGQSPDKPKLFSHQDSSSSNNSSDLCPSVVNSDSGETMHY